MSADTHARGGATVAVLPSLDAWEAGLVVNLRRWCSGPEGQKQVWGDYARTFGDPLGRREMRAFETLMTTVIEYAHRPLVRHGVNCTCVGSDESVFLHLVRTASEGHLADAALIATLLAGPAQAENIALLAGQVGQGARQIAPQKTYGHITRHDTNVVRLH